MKRSILFLTCLLVIGCSSDDVTVNTSDKLSELPPDSPVLFNTVNKNKTRAGSEDKLQELKHYNFGIWGYKETVASNTVTSHEAVFANYLVGFSDGAGNGYDPSGSSYWASSTGNQSDHKSPWFYDGLGTSQYQTSSSSYYAAENDETKSANEVQYISYWDKKFDRYSLWFYSPYRNKDVTFDYDTKTIKVGNKLIHDSYDKTPDANTAYSGNTPDKADFFFGTRTVEKNDFGQDVAQLQMNHFGAQVLIAFYSDIDGYRVELGDLNAFGGKMKDGYTGIATGIQATPAGCTISDDNKVTINTTTKASYTTAYNTVDFDYRPEATTENDNGQELNPSASDNNESTTAQSPKITYSEAADNSTTNSNLIFALPIADAPANAGVSNHAIETGTYGGTEYKDLIPAKATETVDQKYAYSPTVYYPVPQSSEFTDNTTAGFTFHVTLKLIKTDDGSTTAVHNATVYVPPYCKNADNDKVLLTQWQQNTRYTYVFKITKDVKGTTDPDDPIDPDDPKPNDNPALVSLVLDNAVVSGFDATGSAYELELTGNTIPVIPVSQSKQIDAGYSESGL